MHWLYYIGELDFIEIHALIFQGLEDHLGDMDFKIAGTRSGVTAIQLDIKPAGIPLDIVCESLENAREARLQILDHMEREINSPRAQDGTYSPRLGFLSHLLLFWLTLADKTSSPQNKRLCLSCSNFEVHQRCTS